MKPLKELPILRLPFRAMEEVSKGIHSIIKMMSNRRTNEFPILRLPFLAIEEIFKVMHPIEIINFSMISKRTKAVAKYMSFYPKYKIDLYIKETLEIWFLGTRNIVIYVMTSDKEMDKKIEEKDGFGSILPVPLISRKVFKYSKDPVDEWKLLFKHVREIFKKQSINCLTATMDAFVEQNVSIIDFLKVNLKSVDRCTVSQKNREINVDEHTAYLLDNIEINSQLCYDVYIKDVNFNGTFSKYQEELYIKNSEWIGYERLLEIDCKSVILEKNLITNEQWNLFFKKWIAMETHLNLEHLQLIYRNFEEFRALVLHDIPHEVVDEGAKRTFKTQRNHTQELNGGIDIKRIDGKTATLFVFGHRWFGGFLMCIH
ncbi:hypothetical protein CRE_09779 [Caenorhabditis remanei]|uniref:F-box domain-containing protein n=1 Tax=Caenorhabditis remanei TaxID=31234 RepID=E3NDE1_CAERE|nr:hypothetical protein CRE_09779 [Caenorhabditis remanei]